jgi:hypothetical protein
LHVDDWKVANKTIKLELGYRYKSLLKIQNQKIPTDWTPLVLCLDFLLALESADGALAESLVCADNSESSAMARRGSCNKPIHH